MDGRVTQVAVTASWSWIFVFLVLAGGYEQIPIVVSCCVWEGVCS